MTVAVAVAAAGCRTGPDLDLPGRTIKNQTVRGHTGYQLYVPSTYDRKHHWPLIVLCTPKSVWSDTASRHSDWFKAAEAHGFLLAVPDLKSPPSRLGSLGTKREKRPDRPHAENEQSVLDLVRQVQAAYRISDDRVFLVGLSKAATTALCVGLKHPDCFRAVVFQHGRFDEAALADLADTIDPHQPVGVIYAHSVAGGDDGRQCHEWLGRHDVNVRLFEVGLTGRDSPDATVGFIQDVIRKQPWLRIRTLAVEGGQPLDVQFKTKSSFKPIGYLWQFGDGDESPLPEPVHRYATPGTYRVTLEVLAAKRRRLHRTIEITVPQLHALDPVRSTFPDASK